MFGNFYVTIEIDCIVNWCTVYFYLKWEICKAEELQQKLKKRNEMYTKRQEFKTFFLHIWSVNLDTQIREGDNVWSSVLIQQAIPGVLLNYNLNYVVWKPSMARCDGIFHMSFFVLYLYHETCLKINIYIKVLI